MSRVGAAAAALRAAAALAACLVLSLALAAHASTALTGGTAAFVTAPNVAAGDWFTLSVDSASGANRADVVLETLSERADANVTVSLDGGATWCATATNVVAREVRYLYTAGCALTAPATVTVRVYSPRGAAYRLTPLLGGLSCSVQTGAALTGGVGALSSGASLTPFTHLVHANASTPQTCTYTITPSSFAAGSQCIALGVPVLALWTPSDSLQIFAGTDTGNVNQRMLSLVGPMSPEDFPRAHQNTLVCSSSSASIVFTRSNASSTFTAFFRVVATPIPLTLRHGFPHFINHSMTQDQVIVYSVSVPTHTAQLFVESLTYGVVALSAHNGAPLPTSFSASQHDWFGHERIGASVRSPVGNTTYYISLWSWHTEPTAVTELGLYVSCSGAVTFNHSRGTFSDGSGPYSCYQPGEQCTWLIAPTNHTDIFIYFSEFETHRSSSSLQVFNGSVGLPTVAPYVEYAGRTTSLQMLLYNTASLVNFTTLPAPPRDMFECAGFQGHFVAYERGVPVLATDATPLSHRLFERERELFTVQASAATGGLNVRVQFFHPERRRRDRFEPPVFARTPARIDCRHNTLPYLFELGYTASAPHHQTASFFINQPNAPAGTYYCVVEAFENVHLETISRVPTACGGTFTSHEGLFSLLTSTPTYPSVSTCTVTIAPPGATSIFLEFDAFVTALPDDYVEVIDAAGLSHGVYKGYAGASGSQLPSYMEIVTSSVTLVLHSSTLSPQLGFAGFYYASRTALPPGFFVDNAGSASGSFEVGHLRANNAIYAAANELTLSIAPQGGVPLSALTVYIGNNSYPRLDSYFLRIDPPAARSNVPSASSTALQATFATQVGSTYFVAVYSPSYNGSYALTVGPAGASNAGAIAGAVIGTFVVLAVIGAVVGVLMRRRALRRRRGLALASGALRQPEPSRAGLLENQA